MEWLILSFLWRQSCVNVVSTVFRSNVYPETKWSHRYQCLLGRVSDWDDNINNEDTSGFVISYWVTTLGSITHINTASFKRDLHLSCHLFSNALVFSSSTSQRHASVVVINNLKKKNWHVNKHVHQLFSCKAVIEWFGISTEWLTRPVTLVTICQEENGRLD